MFLTQPMLMGAPELTAVNITAQNIHDTTGGPLAESRYQLQSVGQARSYTSSGGYANISGEWLISGAGDQFEVRATQNSGTVTSGPIGTWESLGSDQEWTKERNSAGSVTVQLLIEIRRAADTAVLDSAIIDITAEIS